MPVVSIVILSDIVVVPVVVVVIVMLWGFRQLLPLQLQSELSSVRFGVVGLAACLVVGQTTLFTRVVSELNEISVRRKVRLSTIAQTKLS